MSVLRTVVFVDGRNFKYNLAAFAFHGVGDPVPNRMYRLDEKHFRWREFFLGVVNKFDTATGWTHRLVRVYWYNAATMRPFEVYDRAVQKVLDKYKPQFPELTGDSVVELAREWYSEQRRFFDQTKEVVLERIQRKVDFLEFKYVGEYVVKPFEPYKFVRRENGDLLYQGVREGEKGVDVGIAVDMIAKIGEYDAAILVSGDADFLPVARYVKDHLRAVYQFSLARGIPPRITYLTPWLIGCVDLLQWYDELELLNDYLDRSAGIPRAVLEAIDQRIAQLKQSSSFD